MVRYTLLVSFFYRIGVLCWAAIMVAVHDLVVIPWRRWRRGVVCRGRWGIIAATVRRRRCGRSGRIVPARGLYQKNVFQWWPVPIRKAPISISLALAVPSSAKTISGPGFRLIPPAAAVFPFVGMLSLLYT